MDSKSIQLLRMHSSWCTSWMKTSFTKCSQTFSAQSMVFERIAIGPSCIEKVDMVMREDKRTGEPYFLVFLHFRLVDRTPESEYLADKINKDGEVKVQYDHPWFWKLRKNVGTRTEKSVLALSPTMQRKPTPSKNPCKYFVSLFRVNVWFIQKTQKHEKIPKTHKYFFIVLCYLYIWFMNLCSPQTPGSCESCTSVVQKIWFHIHLQNQDLNSHQYMRVKYMV